MREKTKLDTKDRRLLAELDANSRISLSELSKKLRVSRETVNYRIKRLILSGYIRRFVTHIDYTKLGYDIYAIYFKFGIIDEKKEIEIINYLKNLPNTNWAAQVGGRFDFILEFPAKNIRDFKRRSEEILSKYPTEFIKNDVAVFTLQERLNRRYLYPISQKIVQEKEKFIEISEKEKRVIDILKGHARMPTSEIAKRTKIPASTVALFIKNLKKRGIIKNFTIMMDPTKMDYHNFKACIKMSKYSEKIKSKMQMFCENNQFVVYYIACVGPWDYEIDFETTSHSQYRRALRDFTNLMGDALSDIETMEIFNTFRFNV
ncbi:MAG: Lrp/AsnC family transcriptional regulator [archaeon]